MLQYAGKRGLQGWPGGTTTLLRTLLELPCLTDVETEAGGAEETCSSN